jgi:hypothetical protein
MEITELIILGLATWRLTSIINREKITDWLRRILGVTKDKTTGLESWPDNFITNLLACFWCLSVWVAAGLYITSYYFPEINYVLAAAAVALMVEQKGT